MSPPFLLTRWRHFGEIEGGIEKVKVESFAEQGVCLAYLMIIPKISEECLRNYLHFLSTSTLPECKK